MQCAFSQIVTAFIYLYTYLDYMTDWLFYLLVSKHRVKLSALLVDQFRISLLQSLPSFQIQCFSCDWSFVQHTETFSFLLKTKDNAAILAQSQWSTRTYINKNIKTTETRRKNPLLLFDSSTLISSLGFYWIIDLV